MVDYIHTHEDWPRFHWNRESLAERLAAVRHEQGRLLGRMETLGFKLRQEAVLRTLTKDVLRRVVKSRGKSWTRSRSVRRSRAALAWTSEGSNLRTGTWKESLK